MIHDVLDIEHWKAVFPLDKLRQEARLFERDQQARHAAQQAGQAVAWPQFYLAEPAGEAISSPYHTAVVEQLREEALAKQPLLDRVITDVFVWARGEPEKRYVT